MKPALEKWVGDLRHAARSLLRAPGFTLVRRRNARARHRREHGDLQRRQRRAPRAVAVPTRGPARPYRRHSSRNGPARGSCCFFN